MSRAGKFIPGGTGRKTTGLGGTAGRTGPIRAPETPPAGEPPSGGKRLFPKGSGLVKPVSKNQRLPIIIMSGLVCCLLVSVAWYQFAYVPLEQKASDAEQKAAAVQKQLADALAAQDKAKQDLLKAQTTARSILIVDSRPSGATASLGDVHMQTPATFTDLIPGKMTLTIHADGYRDYQQDLNLPANKPTDLGVIALAQKLGNLSLTSPQGDVTYMLTGPNSYSHQGQVPDQLQGLPVGEYQLFAMQHDWKLPPVTLTINDQDNIQKEIKFPYATVTLTTSPPGATVRSGHTALGNTATPLVLSQQRPGDLALSFDLPPYTVQRLTLHLPDGGNVTKQITLQKGKDFIAACGLPMVWIADSGYWAAKYEMPQNAFETVANYNPSTFRRPNRPVETISWDQATAFCDKLNQYERKAGKLPAGYHYSLPTESQWAEFAADADIDQAPMSRLGSLSSTQDVGASEPNKYGLYDTIGNVWEWCIDQFDPQGDHSMRGGSWLSSAENFPSIDTRNAGGPKYADRFTGFRVVLVPD